MVRAEVAEWQTRRSQKPLGRKAHVGSTPTFGTTLIEETCTSSEARFGIRRQLLSFA